MVKKKKSRPAKPVRADAKSTRFPLKGKAKRISVQDSIAYKEMGKDGICRVADHVYSKTIRFYDINYQLAQNDDKSAIFENWVRLSQLLWTAASSFSCPSSTKRAA